MNKPYADVSLNRNRESEYAIHGLNEMQLKILLSAIQELHKNFEALQSQQLQQISTASSDQMDTFLQTSIIMREANKLRGVIGEYVNV